MGQIQISGTIQGGPAAGGDTFPGSQFIAALKLSSSPKGFQYASGILTRLFTNDSSFVEASAVGPTRDVPRATTLYMKGAGSYTVRLTQDDGSGGTTTATLYCYGVTLLEFPETRACVLIEVQANTTIEYIAAG